MATLPRADEAIAPIEKFTCYALDPQKSCGKSAAFQKALGYNAQNAAMLAANILNNLERFPAEFMGDTGYGEKYAVLMELMGANGKKANVMTVWLDDKATGKMRMVSAYVKKRKAANP